MTPRRSRTFHRARTTAPCASRSPRATPPAAGRARAAPRGAGTRVAAAPGAPHPPPGREAAPGDRRPLRAPRRLSARHGQAYAEAAALSRLAGHGDDAAQALDEM